MLNNQKKRLTFEDLKNLIENKFIEKIFDLKVKDIIYEKCNAWINEEGSKAEEKLEEITREIIYALYISGIIKLKIHENDSYYAFETYKYAISKSHITKSSKIEINKMFYQGLNIKYYD